jgi:predicted TIM-barrel fold metal-dependent hydrolase
VLVDSHVHLLPDRLGAAIRRFFDQRMTPGLAAPALLYPYQHVAAREALAAAGVDRCWSLPYAHKPGMATSLNRWMAETFAADAMVIPGGTVHPDDDVEAVVRDALGALGLKVLKLHCSVGRFDADDVRLDPVWRHVSASGHPVVVHVGHAENGDTSADELAPIARAARRWPEARIVVAHCGAPAVEATLTLLAETRAVHADLTPMGTGADHARLDRGAGATAPLRERRPEHGREDRGRDRVRARAPSRPRRRGGRARDERRAPGRAVAHPLSSRDTRRSLRLP